MASLFSALRPCWSVVIFVPSIVSVSLESPIALVPSIPADVFHIRLKPGSLALRAQMQGINRAPLNGAPQFTPFHQFISADTGEVAALAKCLSAQNSGLFVTTAVVIVANTNQSWGP